MTRNFNRDNKILYRGGEAPRGGLLFDIDVKGGEIEKGMETERENHADRGIDGHRGSMSIIISMPKCFHQCERGRLLDNWFA
jgi:hypothetical protein